MTKFKPALSPTFAPRSLTMFPASRQETTRARRTHALAEKATMPGTHHEYLAPGARGGSPILMGVAHSSHVRVWPKERLQSQGEALRSDRPTRTQISRLAPK